MTGTREELGEKGNVLRMHTDLRAISMVPLEVVGVHSLHNSV